MLLYLPLAHNYGRLLHLSAAYTGFTIAFLPDPLRAGAELPRVRPTLFPSVPRVYEKIHTAVVAGFDERDGRAAAHRRLGARASGGASRACGRRSGRCRALLALQHRLADRLVYSKVKERLGGRLRVANAGGAPLSPRHRRVLPRDRHPDPRGLRPVRGDDGRDGQPRRRDFRFGTVGKPLPGVEIRIAEDGEILLRSNTVFAGYYRDDEATRAALDDEGFVHTGDVGHLDEDGFLVITDRKKDIIVTAGGKNVAPQNLENELKAHTVDLAGARRRRPHALHRGAASRSIRRRRRAADGAGRATAVQAAVDAVNAERSRYEQIKRFTILPREFTLEEDEMTPTLKLRRKVILDHFAAR